MEDAVNDSYGEFLLHPDVTINNHPLASIKFISKGYGVSATNFFNQRFGIPTYTRMEEITANAPTAPYAEVPTMFSRYNYVSDKWESIGYIHTAGKPALDYDKLATPFDYYQMQHNAANPGTIVTMKGALVGNESPDLNILENSWKGFANSYMAAIKTNILLSLLAEHNISSIQVGPDNTEINSSNVGQWPYIQPGYCQFLVSNTGAQFNLTLNYKDLVWDPSFEEEVTPTRSLMKGTLTTDEPVEIDTTLDGSGIFGNPEPVSPPEHDDK